MGRIVPARIFLANMLDDHTSDFTDVYADLIHATGYPPAACTYKPEGQDVTVYMIPSLQMDEISFYSHVGHIGAFSLPAIQRQFPMLHPRLKSGIVHVVYTIGADQADLRDFSRDRHGETIHTRVARAYTDYLLSATAELFEILKDGEKLDPQVADLRGLAAGWRHIRLDGKSWEVDVHA